jgi:hypothetical protein
MSVHHLRIANALTGGIPEAYLKSGVEMKQKFHCAYGNRHRRLRVTQQWLDTRYAKHWHFSSQTWLMEEPCHNLYDVGPCLIVSAVIIVRHKKSKGDVGGVPQRILSRHILPLRHTLQLYQKVSATGPIVATEDTKR